MQVDRTNLKDILPQILLKINQADFVSFDCQFTGLVTKLQKIQGMFSNHIQFYERIKETAFNFRIIQLGVAAFVFKDGIYHPSVYNFYVSPSTFTKGYNNVMVCQVESMEFLAKNHLDFNRVFCKGIKSKRLYANDEDQKHQYNDFPVSTAENTFLSPQQKQIALLIQQQFVKELINNFKLQRVVDFKNRTLFSYFRQKYYDMLFDKTKKNMKQFQYTIRFRQKYEIQSKETKQKIEIQFKEQNNTKNEADCKKEGQQKSEEQKSQVTQKMQQKQIQKQEQTIQAIEEEPQLTKIFASLISGKKPIIGHFPNLDIGLIYQTFIGDLPETYDEFCYHLNQMFPFLFDTKVISRRIQSRLKGLKVDLGSLFRACSNPKLLEPYSNFSIAGLQEYVQKEHQAGYDAFITGCSFIGMANYLAGSKGRIQFKALQAQNMLLYSRFSGEVSMNGNRYCSNSLNYDNLIVIQPFNKSQQPKWREIAEELSKFGSLIVHEDHDEIYYVYEQPRNIPAILQMYPHFNLLPYSQRRIIHARNMYKEMNNLML